MDTDNATSTVYSDISCLFVRAFGDMDMGLANFMIPVTIRKNAAIPIQVIKFQYRSHRLSSEFDFSSVLSFKVNKINAIS